MMTNRETDTKRNPSSRAKLATGHSAKQTRKFWRRFGVWFGVGSALLLTTIIFFQIAFSIKPIIAGQYFLAQISTAMGMGASASVPSNPFNSLVQQFQEREKMLLEKEKELQQKDAALQEQANERQNSQNWLLIVLLILVLLNFYLDYRRQKE